MPTPTILASRAIEAARFTLGGAGYQFPAHVVPIDLVNEAGDLMCSMHEWEWLRGATTTLDLKANQSYAKLPDDFKRLIWQDHTNGLISRLSMVSPAEFLELRTSTVTTATFEYYGSIAYARPTNGGPVTPRLELWPTPTATEAGALTIAYEAGWRYVEEANEALTLPPWMAPVFYALLEIVARGRLEEDRASLAARLEGFSESDLFRAAVRRDAQAQSDRGRMTNTHTSPGASAAASVWPYNYTTVEGPS